MDGAPAPDRLAAASARGGNAPAPDLRESSKAGARLSYLDGLRGLAAAQVVLRHYLMVFLPGLGLLNEAIIHYRWELVGLRAPYFFVSDGSFWVSLFFVISGAVLTIAHDRHPIGFVPALAQRVVRLGGPMAVALAFSALVISAAPEAFTQATVLSGAAPFLGESVRLTTSFAEVVHQALLNGMLAGYRETTLLPRCVMEALSLDGVAHSLDPPLWSLHIEFWGSILILSLCALRRQVSRPVHALLTLPIVLALSRHVLLAFVAGHLFAVIRTSRPWSALQTSRFASGVGLLCIAVGILSCTNPRWGWMAAWISSPLPLPGYASLHMQGLYAAIVLFIGVTLCAPVRSALSCSPMRWLGRNSFGIYLVHAAILDTVPSAIFVTAHAHMPYGAAVLLAAAAGVPLTLVAAAIFTDGVNRRFVALGRAIGAARLLRVTFEPVAR